MPAREENTGQCQWQLVFKVKIILLLFNCQILALVHKAMFLVKLTISEKINRIKK